MGTNGQKSISRLQWAMLDGGQSLTVRYRSNERYPGVIEIDCIGLVTDASVEAFWAALESPQGLASVVSVFNFTQAITTYRRPPRLVQGAPQMKPGCYVCRPDQYDAMWSRSELFNSLNVRRAVFLSQALALEWAVSEVRLGLSRSPPLQRAQPDSAFRDR